jgi:hypothetical protein
MSPEMHLRVDNALCSLPHRHILLLGVIYFLNFSSSIFQISRLENSGVKTDIKGFRYFLSPSWYCVPHESSAGIVALS